jgi:hypothetical protein
LLISDENPLPSIRTLEHGLKKASQSISTHTSPLIEVCVDPPSLHPRPDSRLREKHNILGIITGFVVLLFAWSNAQWKPLPGTVLKSMDRRVISPMRLPQRKTLCTASVECLGPMEMGKEAPELYISA